MMQKNALLLYGRKSMLAIALAEGLEKKQIRVAQALTDANKLANLKEPSETVLFYLQDINKDEEIMQGVTTVFEYVRDRSENGEPIRLFLLGNPDELASASEIIPREHITKMFTRPFRTDDVAEAIRNENADADTEHSRRILVVDDDATMLRTIRTMLSSNDYRVYTANSGMNAIQLLHKARVDLILLDYEMPDLKGPQVLEMIRNDEQIQEIPVMFLTAKSDRQSISEVLSMNPESYLLKSLPQTAILSAIDNFFLKG